jgi:hypothetical protein
MTIVSQASNAPGALTFARWHRLMFWLPSWARCGLHAQFPATLEGQAGDALAADVERRRNIGREAGMVHVSEPIRDELNRLRDTSRDR